MNNEHKKYNNLLVGIRDGSDSKACSIQIFFRLYGTISGINFIPQLTFLILFNLTCSSIQRSTKTLRAMFCAVQSTKMVYPLMYPDDE